MTTPFLLDDLHTGFPRDLSARLELLHRIVCTWFGGEDSWPSRDFLPELPTALRHVHWLGRDRPGLLHTQNRFLAPKLLQEEDGFTTFYAENQWVYVWAYGEGKDVDPVVYGQFLEEEPWVSESRLVSDFVIHAVLMEALFGAPWHGCAIVDGAADADAAFELYPMLDLTPLRWPAHPCRIGGRGDALILASPNGPEVDAGWTVFVGGRSTDGLAPLGELGWAWEARNFG